MTLVALKCPQCNGDVQMDDTREFGFCMYCGCKVMIQEALRQQSVVIDDSKKISGWAETALLFLKNSNREEAYRYAKMVTDADNDNPDGWLVRGCCAVDKGEADVAMARLKALVSEDDPRVKELKTRLRSLAPIVVTIDPQTPERFSTTATITLDGEEIKVPIRGEYRGTVEKGPHEMVLKFLVNGHVWSKVASFTVVRAARVDILIANYAHIYYSEDADAIKRLFGIEGRLGVRARCVSAPHTAPRQTAGSHKGRCARSASES